MGLRTFVPLVAFLVCVAACAPAPGADAGPSPGERPPRILRADADGAVIFDPGQAAISGFTRSGDQVWRNTAIVETATDIVCLARCPATVVSTETAPDRPAVQ